MKVKLSMISYIQRGTLLWAIIAVSLLACIPESAVAQEKHFDPKGKLPSTFTIEKQQELRKTLPFDDERDFEESRKGLLATPDFKQIKTEDGTVAWDMGSYEWLLDGKDFDSIHPSLQRQAILNMN
jgi:alkyl sulfatase BDS1-like metallo-beta-lactamase superfamily hydrolase